MEALSQSRRQRHPTQEQTQAAITLSTKLGFPLLMACRMVLRGWACAEQGQERLAQRQLGLAALRHMEEGAQAYSLVLAGRGPGFHKQHRSVRRSEDDRL